MPAKTPIELADRVEAFSQLSSVFQSVAVALDTGSRRDLQQETAHLLFEAAQQSTQMNPWFDRSEIARALYGLAAMTGKTVLKRWLDHYPVLRSKPCRPKNIAVIMAGNIPLVGFHDFMSVLISGHSFVGKLSSQDALLPQAVAKLLILAEPKFEHFISFTKNIPEGTDAYIATGSDNTARYFDHLFSNKSHIIRKNRQSLAVLTGNESKEELESLGVDVFAYYGLGCRSVSHLLLPAGFDVRIFIEAWKPFSDLLVNVKYQNNLRYNRALSAVENLPFTDTGICLLQESAELASAISVVHFSYYQNTEEALRFIRERNTRLQCIVSNAPFLNDHPLRVPFGQSQFPGPEDYADGIDTIKFLTSLDA